MLCDKKRVHVDIKKLTNVCETFLDILLTVVTCSNGDFVILNHIFRDDDGSDEDSPPPGTASITSFFAPKKDSVVYQRHQFFRDRHLEPVNSF